ncbi:hypothetical protein D9M71_211320 [compost metagenome]
MQGLLDLLGQQAVGGDGHEHVGGLHADLEVLEVQLVEMIDMAHGRLEQGFGGRFAVFLLQVLFQRSCVHPDANRDVLVAGSVDHRLDAILAADVAGVDAQAIDAQLSHAQGDLVVEVDIRHQRHLDLLLDLAKGFRGIHVRHGNPHDVGAGLFQAANLRNGSGDVQGVGVGHALHSNGRIAAHWHVADPDLARGSTDDRRSTMHLTVHLTSGARSHRGSSAIHRPADRCN